MYSGDEIKGQTQEEPGKEYKMDLKPIYYNTTTKGYGRLKDEVAIVIGGDVGESRFAKDSVDAFGQDTPLKRPGQPVELAESYVFLTSDGATYITGQTIHVNGGKVLKG